MEMSEPENQAMRRWVDTWKGAGPELERIKQEELRALTDKEAAAQSQDLFRLGDQWIEQNPGFERESGLVEQQRWFMKWWEKDRT